MKTSVLYAESTIKITPPPYKGYTKFFLHHKKTQVISDLLYIKNNVFKKETV